MEGLSTSTFAWMFALGLGPTVIRVARRVQAHRPALAIAADGLRASFFAVMVLGLVLPRGLGSTCAFVATVLAVWDTWLDIRDWRRSKATGPTG